MASCQTLGTGLEALARYMAVISDAASFELVAAHHDAWLALGGSGFARPVPRQRYAFGLLSLLVICRWVTRRPIVPAAAAHCRRSDRRSRCLRCSRWQGG